MGFAEVAEMAFSTGPQWAKKFAKPSRLLASFFERIINSFNNLLNYYKFLFRLQVSYTDQFIYHIFRYLQCIRSNCGR